MNSLVCYLPFFTLNGASTKTGHSTCASVRLTLIGTEVSLKCDFHINKKMALIKRARKCACEHTVFKYPPLSPMAISALKRSYLLGPSL